jgi:PPM family protein phosphatase
MQETHSPIPDPSSRDRGLSRLDCVLLWFAVLGTGTLLSWLGGGFPPRVWRQFVRLHPVLTPSQPQFLLLLVQGALLLAAWGLLLILTLRLTIDCRSLLSARRAQQHASRQGSRKVTGEIHKPPQDMHAVHTPVSVPLHLQRASATGGQDEDEARDSSRPLQGEDAAQRSPWWLLQPVLFGEPLLLNAVSCRDEGTQHESSTAASLLTDVGGRDSAAPLRPVSFFALADHLPAEEPGYTTICHAIESMRDTVMHASSGSQPLADHTLVTLLEEQVQHVTRIIGKQSQGDETLAALVASLIIGSTLFVANSGDTRAYLCRSPQGFSQVTEPSSFNEERSSITRQGPPPSRGKQNERRKSPARISKDHPFAVPLHAGDTILLCSDGLWSILHTTYLEQIMRSTGPDPSDICAALLLAVRKSGNTDPVRLIVVHCHHRHHENRFWQEPLDVPSGRSGKVIQQARGEP